MKANLAPPILEVLSARALDVWDKCQKRYAYELNWEYRPITLLELTYRALDAALACSAEADPEEVAKSTALKIISESDIASTSALDTYTMAVHHGMLAGIIAKVLRSKLSSMLIPAAPRPLPFVAETLWHSGLKIDSNGLLHRVVLCSHIDDDRLRSEAHSWLSIGELVAHQQPHTIHLVKIGSERDGRRHSPWMRGQLHPVTGTLRFAKWKRPGGQGRTSPPRYEMPATWRDCWRENATDISTANWIRIMNQDGVLDQLIKSRELKWDPSDARMLQAQRDIIEAMAWMTGADVDVMMRRSACDDYRGPCPFQSCCYSREKATPEAFPKLYQPRILT